MIFIEDQLIKLNGVVLPGLVKSIEVSEAAKVDEQEVEGSATKPKQATGYEDSKVIIELILDDTQTQSEYQRLSVLRSVFRLPNQGVPQPIPIVSQDTAVHGIDRVIFKQLTHKGENKKGQLTVTMELWQYIPQTITATKEVSSGSSGSSSSGYTGSGSTQSNASSEYQSSLSSEYKSYLENDRGKSPAIDNASSAAALNRVAAMPY